MSVGARPKTRGHSPASAHQRLDSDSIPDRQTGRVLARFIEERQRRHVFKLMAFYAMVAWLLIPVIVAVEGPRIL